MGSKKRNFVWIVERYDGGWSALLMRPTKQSAQKAASDDALGYAFSWKYRVRKYIREGQ